MQIYDIHFFVAYCETPSFAFDFRSFVCYGSLTFVLSDNVSINLTSNNFPKFVSNEIYCLMLFTVQSSTVVNFQYNFLAIIVIMTVSKSRTKNVFTTFCSR